MFIARIELTIAREQRDRFRAYAAAAGLEARALAGCVRYSFFEDIADPGRSLLYEEWTTREAFDAYKASTVFAETGFAAWPMLSAPPKSAYYESEDLFAAGAVRG